MTCRRCTECQGETHHWMDECTDDNGEPVEPHFVCKHCEHTCAAVDCDICGDLVPVEITFTNDQTGKSVCLSCF